MKFRLRMAISLLISLCILGFLSATANGDPTPDTTDLTPAERGALEFISKDEGVSFEQSVKRYAWQDDFAIAGTEIRRSFPDSFSSIDITSETPPAGTIRFKNDVPDGVQDILSALPETIKIQLMPYAGMSANEVDEIMVRAGTESAEIGGSRIENLSSSYDRQSGKVEVIARSTEELTSEERDKLAKEIVSDFPSDLRPYVSLALSPNIEGAVAEARYGGGRLEQRGTERRKCTARFNVANGSRSGIATAGHCRNDLSHMNCSTCIEFRMTYQTAHRGGWGDFQWHTSKDSKPPTFYADFGVKYNVHTAAFPANGQRLCRFGQATGWDWADVDDPSRCETVSGVYTCRLARMDEDTAAGGDSGGPWYFGNTAYGYHTGQSPNCTQGVSSCDIFSKAENIFEAIGTWPKRV